MRFHTDEYRDPRTRFYLPVQRILLNSWVEHPEELIGNRQFQTVICYDKSHVLFPPGSSIVLDFGHAVHGGIRFNQIASQGLLRVKFGESVSEAIGNSDQDSSRKDAKLELPNCGMLEYGNTVFRFVQLSNVGDIPLYCQNVMAVVLERDIEVTGSFESSDERLNSIWKTAVRTVHLCMQDYIYDGAKRDRIIWMGDMHPEIRGILAAFSDTSIIRDSFEFLMNQAPGDKPMNGEFYSYSCWFIIAFWDYFRSTGDMAFLKKHADYIRVMLRLFVTFIGPDGSEQLPEHRFLDWPNEDNPKAKHAGLQALLVWMLTAGGHLLRVLGDDAAYCDDAVKKLRGHVPDPAGRKAPAALLTLTGLADRRDVLENDPFHGVSTFYGYYVLQAKNTVPALELIRNYWGAMLDYGATSFWEDFDLDWLANTSRIDEPPVPGKKDLHADFGNYCYQGLRHSLSHGWSCGPAPFLSERVLGVQFPEPGKVRIVPDLGDLAFVRGTVPTPYGIIEVEADRSGKVLSKIPKGLTKI